MSLTRRHGLKLGLAAAFAPFAAQADETSQILRLTEPGAELGEGPLWVPSQNTIFWVDIMGKKLHAYRLADKSQQSWDMPDIIGWVLERTNGGLIVAQRQDVCFLDLDPFKLTKVATPETQHPDNRLNDAKVDAKGRLWTGTMHMPFKEKTAALYRIDADLKVRKMDTPYLCTNGPAFSRDGRRMYHNETADGIVYAFDVADGELSNKRVFAKFAEGEGLPDGCTVDADDGFWVAHYGGGGISRYLPDGTKDFDIRMPARNITSVTFGGENLDRLFVTSAAQEHRKDDPLAGTLFEVPKPLLRGHKGLPTNKFAG